MTATAGRPSPPRAGTVRRAPVLRRPAGQLAVALLLVAATVGWRRGQYFSGTVDTVVAGKAAVGLLALGLAFLAATGGSRRPVGTGTLWVLAALLGGSVLGAWTSGSVFSGGLVATRVAIVGLAVFLLLRSADARSVLLALTRACGLVALAATVTGLPSAATGRLAGGLPPLAPNELALLAGVVVLVGTWSLLLGGGRWPTALAVLAATGVVWATGSRTGLAMLLLGVLVVVLHVRRFPLWSLVGGPVAAAAATAAALGTDLLAGFAGRDGDGIGTLESRFIAWDAARTWAGSAWQAVLGGGLSVKVIRVRGQWWTEQPLDSSWVSVFVQAGVLGLAIAACWVLWVVRGALRVPPPHRALLLGLLVFLVGRSVVESGLFDATPAFLLFLAVSLLAEGGGRRRLQHESAPPGGPAARSADDRREVGIG
ncbi:O-antigen ligase [Geodermatophilus bullaregiensis]|uniref:hypothetical protein n=1 Tax=Geodermatophilus bullaregiensis TaxID=1564160 RepID=UPI00195D7634|nr:hypothetical protein [Geodermatophilus bullaregiensis]MBM7807386.1 O-antigen ligase [Geodermatophilus bullaregiensis]